MLEDHQRYAYQPIAEREPYDWPNGARLAVAVTVNIEQFPFGQGNCVQFLPGQRPPDVLNYSWCEYGNRVGFWRLLEMFDAFALPVSMLLNSEIYDHCPQIPDAIVERGDEIVSHGRTNAERQADMSEEEERRLIAGVTETIARHQGNPPTGWMGPGLSESRVTPDLLEEAGYRYLMDWGPDDQPIWMKTRGGRILLIPYPKPTGDIAAIHGYHVTPSDYADMMIDQFDEMLRQSRSQPLIYALSLHAYIMGHPFRLKHLRRILEHIGAHRDEIWLAPTGQIAEHVMGLPSGVVP